MRRAARKVIEQMQPSSTFMTLSGSESGSTSKLALPSSFKPVPAGFTLYKEGGSEILISGPQSSKEQQSDAAQSPVFINPIQEFNRDVSLAAIAAWSTIRDFEKRTAWDKKQLQGRGRPAKKRKLDNEIASQAENEEDVIAFIILLCWDEFCRTMLIRLPDKRN